MASAPTSPPGARLAPASRHWWRWKDSAGASKTGFETSKNELGLDHNETRSWHGWHRHVSLVMLAFAMLATIRRHANRQPPQKTPLSMIQKTPLSMIQKQNQPSSTGRRRESAASPHGLRSGASSLPISLPGRSGGGLIRPPQSALT